METTYEEAKQKMNAYGNLTQMPQGWVITSLTVPQIKAAGATPLKIVTGWSGTKRYPKPIIYNIVPSSQVPLLERYISLKKSKPQKITKTAIEKYAEWMTTDKDVQYRIIHAYENNRDTGGTAWKLISRAYQMDDVNSAWDAIRMMDAAEYRHGHTDYDKLLKAGWEREEARDYIKNR